MNILLADDDAVSRLVLSRLLQKMGHAVTQCVDGLQAWETFQRDYYPVILTDWKMPAMDGLVLAQLVRAKPQEHYTYIILVSGYGAKENYREGIQAGADDFLVKPVAEDYLDARLLVAERLVQIHNQVRQLESFMPVCSYCKSVREKDNQWVSMEEYVASHAGIKASHTFCPKCFDIHWRPELERMGIFTVES